MIFVAIPIVSSAYLSLTEYRGVKNNPPVYVGFDNFTELLSVEVKEFPYRVDEDTGESVYRCGRKNIVESEVAAYEAENDESCERAFARPREVLSDGYQEVNHYTIFGKTYIIGARDARFWHALQNTTTYVIAVVILNVIFGMGLALALQKQTFFNMTLRTIFFLPSVTSTVAVTVVWSWIFRGQDYGLINAVRNALGADSTIIFLRNVDWTLPVLIMLAVWGGMGYNMILFLAGLQNISQDIYEAASIDGANTRQKFRFITLPLLRPTLLFVTVTGTIGAFQVFESIYVLFTDAEGVGGILDSGLSSVVYLYDQGFRQFNLGYASAIAWILFFIIFVLTLINLRAGRTREEA
ncbi:MAG: sugar ABC transporter permease [Anaerolineae bacterium]|nr:sugar ABC transporter permease [Anaerolineae bacterium]